MVVSSPFTISAAGKQERPGLPFELAWHTGSRMRTTSSTRLKRTRLRDQSRWLLPSSEFAPEGNTGTSGGTDDAKPS